MSKIYDLTHEEWVVLDHSRNNVSGQAERILSVLHGPHNDMQVIENAAYEILSQCESMKKTIERPVLMPAPPKPKEQPKPAKWNPFKKKP